MRRLNSTIEETKQQISDANKEREDPDSERPSKLEMIAKLKQENEEITQKLTALDRTDPRKVEELQKQQKISKEAANRWTDNIFEVKSWVQEHNPNFSSSDLEQQFPILKNLDNI